MVGTDVKALFPSILDLEGARVVKEAVMESDIVWDSIDHMAALRYLTIVGGTDYMKEIGLGRYMPRWKGDRVDLTTVGGEKSHDSRSWKEYKQHVPDHIKKKIVARVLETAVIICMGTHTYTFCGKTYLQESGGPIGMRFTASLANLIMKKWDTRWLKLCEREKGW